MDGARRDSRIALADFGHGSELGVTEDQAKGGTDKIAALVPGASKYMEIAKNPGAVTSPLKNVAGLNSSHGKLGMKPETVSKFAPMVTNYLGAAGGDSLRKMLAGVK